MALGPFISYVPPGVYTRTLTESNVANITAGLRIPVVIGVGQEELNQSNVALVRGSSASVDQQINNEDVSLQWVLNDTNPSNPVLGVQDGTRVQFRVRNFPIVDGQGLGRITNDVRTVTVTVNGLPTAVGQVNGMRGIVTLQVPTQPGDAVRVTYNFHRGDTAFTDDVSDQVTATQAVLTSPGFGPFDITANANDTFRLKVNGTTYTVVLSAGSVSTTQLKGLIDASSIPNLTTSVFVDNAGNEHLQLTSSLEVVVLDGSANGPLGWTNNTSTNRNAVFTVFNRPITDGSGGGLTTTDPSRVVVKVNGLQTLATAVDGQNGKVYLALPPAPGSTVTVAYFANTWQDTFDFLPNSLVTTVSQCGYSPDRATYIQDIDFVVSNPSTDVSVVHWGTSYTVSSTTTSVGGTPLDASQIVGSLNDDEMYLGECERVIDTSTVPATVSATKFLLPEVPTMGNGRNTPLTKTVFDAITNGRQDLTTNRPDLVEVYVGRNLQDATSRGAVTVLTVDGANRLLELKDGVPPDHHAFATFYYNRVADESYVFTCQVPGPVGVGQYTVSSRNSPTLYQVRLGTKTGLAETLVWPRGVELVPDAIHTGAGTAVSETVTVTFSQSDAQNAAYTCKGSSPYSFYTPFSANWTTNLNGTSFVTNLAGSAPAVLVGRHVATDNSGNVVISSGANSFQFQIDGTSVTATLTTGARTPTQVVTEINAAIDAVFAPGPNNLCGYVQIANTAGDVIFYVKSKTTPSTLDSVSSVTIQQGTAQTALGFRAFQQAAGTLSGVNKPATLLSTLAGTYAITTSVNDVFRIRVNGVERAITLPSGAAVTTAAVAAAINAQVPGLASVGTGANLNKLRLTSTTNSDVSNITILTGSANATLGFTQNQFASQTRVTAQEVTNLLNTTASFLTEGIAYPSTIEGRTYITVESWKVGATASSVSFPSGVYSAFNATTGVGIVAGTDGDSGQSAHTIFTVTSDNAAGSAGTGVPGQTYTDGRTGLRFSLLPPTSGSYTLGGSFTLIVSPTFEVNPAIPFYAIPGMELTVSNTVGVFSGDTGTLQTFAPTGVEPKIGDPYYVTYKYLKQDYTTRLFRQLKTIEANFGRTTAENRVTLAAYLAILNGALLVGVKQVTKVPNTNQATDLSFIEALNELRLPLAGGVKPDIIVPLATSTAVYAQLVQHCEVASLIQNQSERMGFVGFASNTTPLAAATVASGLNSNRVVAIYPDSVVITLTDELGQSFESLVDGTFMAAAVAGAVVSPAVDVATPYTRRRILGFTRIPRVIDPVEANQTAVKGVTILEDMNGLIRIRQGLTTNMTNALTRLPTVTQIADFVQQQSRSTLDGFIGTKFLSGRTSEVNITMTSLFKQLVQAEIVAAFTGINSNVDPNDPTVLQFEAYYQPIFPLLYIVLTFNLRAQL